MAGREERVASLVAVALPIAPLVVPLAIHFIFVCFVLLFDWLPVVYFFSHLFFFISGLWTLQNRESLLSIIVYIFVVAVTILLDIILLGLYFGDLEDVYGHGDTQPARTWQFSAAMMIISLIMKPLTIALACIAAYFRSGASVPGFSLGRRGAYSVIGEQSG